MAAVVEHSEEEAVAAVSAAAEDLVTIARVTFVANLVISLASVQKNANEAAEAVVAVEVAEIDLATNEEEEEEEEEISLLLLKGIAKAELDFPIAKDVHRDLVLV